MKPTGTIPKPSTKNIIANQAIVKDSSDTVYLIPGLGADGRMYEPQLSLPFKFKMLEWEKPLSPEESLRSYVTRMANRMEPGKQPFAIIGTSLGGIAALEMAKVVKPKKLVLIATAKTSSEIPPFMRLGKYLPVYKAVTPKTFDVFRKIAHPVVKVAHPMHYTLFHKMIMQSDAKFIKWGMKQAIMRMNEQLPDCDWLHLHGTADHMFPVRYIKQAVIIEKGTHFMNIERADEINRLIYKHLCKGDIKAFK